MAKGVKYLKTNAARYYSTRNWILDITALIKHECTIRHFREFDYAYKNIILSNSFKYCFYCSTCSQSFDRKGKENVRNM